MTDHIRAAEYVRASMNKFYARVNASPVMAPIPRPAGWIDLSHIIPHPQYADAIKKAVFEAHHSELFDFIPCKMTCIPLNYMPVLGPVSGTYFCPRPKVPAPVARPAPIAQPVPDTEAVSAAEPIGKDAEAVTQNPANKRIQQLQHPSRNIEKSHPKTISECTAVEREESGEESEEETRHPVKKSRPKQQLCSDYVKSDRLVLKKVQEQIARDIAATAVIASSSHSPHQRQQSSPLSGARKRPRTLESLNRTAQFSSGKSGSEKQRRSSPPSPSLSRNDTWSEREISALEQALRAIRADEEAHNILREDGIQDERLWRAASTRILANFGVKRTANACKLFWARHGRNNCGFDERQYPNPNMLVTSVQKLKGSAK